MHDYQYFRFQLDFELFVGLLPFLKTLGSLSNCLAAVFKTVFADNRKSAHLQFVLPNEVTTTLGPACLSEIQQSFAVSLYFQPPSSQKNKSWSAGDHLRPLPNYFHSSVPPYQYGMEYEPYSTVHTDPASTRLKRKRYVERTCERRSAHGPAHGAQTADWGTGILTLNLTLNGG